MVDEMSEVFFHATVLSALAFVADLARRTRVHGAPAWLAALLAAWALAAVAAAYGLPPAVAATLFPVVTPIAIGVALLTFARPAVREAVLALPDADVRALFLWRAVLGAHLLSLGAIGRLPASFALAAGLGDLFVGWLAVVLPGRFGAGSRSLALAALCGIGLLDLAQVLVLAVTVVRPYLLERGQSAALPLPWVAVPLMIALQVVWLWSVLRPRPAVATA